MRCLSLGQWLIHDDENFVVLTYNTEYTRKI